VGEALVEIRGSRLYRETDATFEAYCKRRWGFSRQHANRLMDSAEVSHAIAAETSPMGDVPVPPIPNERQARALAPVLRDSGPEAVREAWVEAVETAPEGKVTAAHVEAVVERRAEPVVVVVEEPDADVLEARDALATFLRAADGLRSFSVEALATAVPENRRERVARDLRRVGTSAGHVALLLERRHG
jgi:hypothetical protein